MSNLFRSPLLHFLLIGALLFVAQGWTSSRETVDDPDAFRVAIEADRLDELKTTFTRQMRRRPEPAEVDRMIEAEVEEEILYREAIARGLLERDGGVQTRLIQKMLFLEGSSQIEEAPALLARAIELRLHEDDIVVRRILVQKMKLLGSTLEASQIPSAADVAAAYQEEREELRAPDRLSLVHVFLSSDRRGNEMYADAATLRETLTANETSLDDAPGLADPFPLGHHLQRRSQHDLERTFGARFGEQAFELDLERWSEPIASAYGLHLIYVGTREPGQVPPLDSVSNRLRLQIEDRRRNENLDALLSDLRARYEVVRPTPDERPLEEALEPSLERIQEPG